MATSKKTTKTTSRVQAPSKKSSKPKAARKPSKANLKASNEVRSFRVSRPTRPFMSVDFTRESSYWLVLGIVVIAFGWWIMKLQSDIQAIYDSIDANSNMVITEPTANLNKKQ